MHIYIRTSYIYIKHACIHYIHTYIHTHTHAHKQHTHTNKTCIHAYIHTCIHTYMHPCIRACMHACINTTSKMAANKHVTFIANNMMEMLHLHMHSHLHLHVEVHAKYVTCTLHGGVRLHIYILDLRLCLRLHLNCTLTLLDSHLRPHLPRQCIKLSNRVQWKTCRVGKADDAPDFQGTNMHQARAGHDGESQALDNVLLSVLHAEMHE